MRYCEVSHLIYDYVKLQDRRLCKSMLTSNRRSNNLVYAHPVAFRDCFIASFEAAVSFQTRRVTRIQLTVSVSLRSTRGRAHITPACMRAVHCEEDACIPEWRIRQLLCNARSRGIVFFFQTSSFSCSVPCDQKGKLLRSLLQLPWNRNCPRTDN